MESNQTRSYEATEPCKSNEQHVNNSSIWRDVSVRSRKTIHYRTDDSRFLIDHNIFRFYRAVCNADAVLWWEFCLSVRLSVCPSVTRVYCDKTVETSVQIYISYERTFSLVFWEEEWLVGSDLFYLKFWVNRPPFERNRQFSTNNRS